MISLLGMSYGLLFPAALFAVPLALGLLIYAYLRRGNARPVMVASVFILEQLQNKIFSRKKFIPPLRFFFELLLILLLLAGLSGLFREASGKRYALIIDNSFSMAALDGEQAGAKTRLLTRAVENAGQFLQGLSTGERIELFSSSPMLHSLSSGFVSASAAQALLADVKLAFAADNLEQALRKLSAKGNYQELVIFSDRKASLLNAQNEHVTQISFRSLLAPQQRAERSNLAISSVAWKQGENHDALALSAQVQSYSAHYSKGMLLVEGLSAGADSAKSELVAKSAFNLKPHAEERFNFTNLPERFKLFRLRLEFPGGPSQLRENLILEDDQAWIARDNRAAQALLVGDLEPRQLGLNAISGLKFAWLKPEEYNKERAKLASLVVFHRFVPQSADELNSLPEANALFVLPERENAFFSLIASLQDSQVTSWTESHPLLSYLNLSTLKLKQAQILQARLPATEIMRSSDGALALAFDSAGRRYAAFGFEIFPFEGRNAASLSILTLNTFKWLSDLGGNSGYLNVNSNINNFGSISNLRYLDSAQSGIDLSSEFVSETSKISLPYPGVAELSSAGSGLEHLALNYFDSSESDLNNPAELNLVSAPQVKTSGYDRELLSKFLAASLIMLIVFDLIYLLARLLRQRRLAA